jgi:hypothetical protein
MQGIAQGMKDSESFMISMLGGALEKLVGTGDKKLKTGSPSRVFEQRGIWAGEGLAGGLESTTAMVERAGARMVGASMAFGPMTSGDDVLGPMVTSVGVERSFDTNTTDRSVGNVRVTINQHIEGRGDAAEIGRAAGREARREIEAYFRQLEMET